MLLSHACAFNAVPICTAYDSLGPDGLTHSLNETEVRSMFTNADLLPTLTKIISKCPSVKLVVYDGKPEDGVIAKLQAEKEGLKVIHLDEVIRIGKENLKEATPAKPSDVFCCMYTSGSSTLSILRNRDLADFSSWYAQGCFVDSRECHCCE